MVCSLNNIQKMVDIGFKANIRSNYTCHYHNDDTTNTTQMFKCVSIANIAAFLCCMRLCLGSKKEWKDRRNAPVNMIIIKNAFVPLQAMLTKATRKKNYKILFHVIVIYYYLYVIQSQMAFCCSVFSKCNRCWLEIVALLG